VNIVKTSLSGRIALVTGASRGIGRATALALAKAGAHVIALARTTGGLEELDDEIKAAGGSATLVPHDLKDSDSFINLHTAINERYGKLDILVGNAGILGVLSPLSHVEPKVWDETFAVNVTANWHLIRWMEPLLKQSDAGRAVFVTSGAAWNCRAYWGPYATSKAALNTMARIWAAELGSTPVKVNLLSPGHTRTRMHAQAFPGLDPNEQEAPEHVAESILRLCDPQLQESGKIYSHPDKRFLALDNPA
jgi:NAD(P)-dependent dehydrogenase (short-subunit alcohol dehydrogenase family)